MPTPKAISRLLYEHLSDVTLHFKDKPRIDRTAITVLMRELKHYSVWFT